MLNLISRSGIRSLVNNNVRNMSDSVYKALAVSQPASFVHHVELNRPDRLNAFNPTLWREIKECFDSLSDNPNCRAIVLTGAGKHFSAGLDLASAMQMGQELGAIEDVGRRGHYIEKRIKECQDSISSLEHCTKPVIAAIHAGCIGAGVNLITAADIRYCSDDAFFTVKEIDIGMAADVGALQRLPKIVGNQSWIREICYTGRRVDSKEALSHGLVNRTFSSRDDLIKECIKLAEVIASKSPLAIQATKKNLIYSAEHTNQEGLDQIREINRLNLLSEDFAIGAMAQASKGDPPVFSKL